MMKTKSEPILPTYDNSRKDEIMKKLESINKKNLEEDEKDNIKDDNENHNNENIEATYENVEKLYEKKKCEKITDGEIDEDLCSLKSDEQLSWMIGFLNSMHTVGHSFKKIKKSLSCVKNKKIDKEFHENYEDYFKIPTQQQQQKK